MKKEFSKLENWFLILTLLFGVIFAFLVPPNQVPDEDRHFARVYAILDGNFTSQRVKIPRVLYRLMPDYFTVPGRAEKFEINSYLAQLSSKSDYSEKKEFAPAASYSPIVYFPQLLGVGIGKLLGMNAFGLFVLGRIFSLFLYIGTGYFIIRSSPIATKGLFVFLTMPMNIYIAASYSADTVQLCLTLIYLNIVLVNLHSPGLLTRKEFLGVLLVAALLSFTKPTSLLLILLSFAIPVTRFGSQQKKLLFVASQLGLGMILTFFWTKAISSNIVPALETISPLQQLAFIIFNPIPFIQAVATSLRGNLEFYIYSFVGYFGSLTTPLPNFVYLLFFTVLCIALFADTDTSFALTMTQKYIFLTVFGFYFLSVLFIMYLYWTPPGESYVGGVQGRYFAPIFPLLLYLSASLDKPSLYWIDWLRRVSFGLLVPTILFFSVFTIYQKFFVVCGEDYFSFDGNCKLPVGLINDTPIGEILQPVKQTFTAECGDLNGVGVLFGTYARVNTGTLNISLQDETTDRMIFQKRIKVDKIKDNQWMFFKFSGVPNIKDHEFTITFTPQGSSPGNAITIWSTESDEYVQGELLGFEGERDLMFKYTCPYGLVNTLR